MSNEITEHKMYNIDQQMLFLSIMISDPELYIKVKNITKPEYFDASLKKTVKYIESYNEEYSALPDKLMISTATGIELDPYDSLELDVKQYFLDTYPKFCLHKAMVLAIDQGETEVQNQNYDRLEEIFKDAMSVRLSSDYGLDYSENPVLRLENIKNKTGNISSGFETLDKTIGKLGVGDLVVYIGSSGCVTYNTKVKIVNAPDI